MPHFSNDILLDQALNYFKNNCTKMVLTQGEPTSFANADTNNGTGSGQKISQVNMSGLDFTVGDGDTSGRKITSLAKSSQPVVAAGDASYVAYLDGGNSAILHYYPIQTVRSGLITDDTVNFPAHDLEFRDTEAE